MGYSHLQVSTSASPILFRPSVTMLEPIRIKIIDESSLKRAENWGRGGSMLPSFDIFASVEAIFKHWQAESFQANFDIGKNKYESQMELAQLKIFCISATIRILHFH